MRANWGSRLGFILSSAGATVGFGNLWRFPYLVGENGGGAFLILFLICVLIFGFTLFIAEAAIGRRAKANVLDAYKVKNTSKYWGLNGYVQILAVIATMSYFIVLAGWVIGYLFFVVTGKLEISSTQTSADYKLIFNNMISNFWYIVVCSLVFCLANYYILRSGVSKGIERFSSILMPVLFIMLLILLIRSLTLDGSLKGLLFYITPDFSSFTFNSLLTIMSQVFFTLSIGFGIALTMGSFLNKDNNLFVSVGWIVLLDTLVAVVAGLIIFPAVFAFGLSPTQGSSLVFIALPVIFTHIAFGEFLFILFLFVFLIAALTTTIANFEVIITTLQEKLSYNRSKASFVTIFLIFIFGSIPCILAFGSWSNVKILGLNFFQLMDFLSANVFCTLAALINIVFVGWVLKKETFVELKQGADFFNIESKYTKSWFIFIKYICPTLILIVIIKSLF